MRNPLQRSRSLPFRLPRHVRTLAAAAGICALLLNAAAPLLLGLAAAMQGLPSGALCEVYGIVMPSDDMARHHAMEDGGGMDMAMSHEDADATGAPDEHPAHRPGTHKSDHCALAGLATGAPPLDAPARPGVRPQGAIVEPLRSSRIAIFDAATRWVTRLQHGPPALA